MTDLTAAQQHLDELITEQDDLEERIRDAKRAGDAEEWLRLTHRADELPAEIAAAEKAVVEAQLAAAWQRAEEAVADEERTRARRDEARDAVEAARDAMDGTTDRRHELERALEEQADAVKAWRRADREVVLALTAIDDLEDRHPDRILQDGNGALARETRELDSTVHLRHPTDGRHSFLAGTVPPRWAAWIITADVYREPRP